MKSASLLVAIIFVASAAAFGGGVGQLVGVAGSAAAVAVAGMALVLATAPEVSALTAARAVGLMAAAAGLGCVADGVAPAAWKTDPATWRDFPIFGQTLLALAIRGAMRIGAPIVLFAIALTGKLRGGLVSVALAGVIMALQYGGGRLVDVLPVQARSLLSQSLMTAAPLGAGGQALEMWGGAITLLAGVFLWAKFILHDGVAVRLGIWALAAGAVGLPLAHVVGSLVAANAASLPTDVLRQACGSFNSELVKEILFGGFWGAIVSCGAWRNRDSFASTPDVGSIRLPWEVGLFAFHVTLALAAAFVPLADADGWLKSYAPANALFLAIPLICIFNGRRAPWVAVLGVVIAPVVVVAVRYAVYESHRFSPGLGWIFLVAAPVAMLLACAAWATSEDEGSVGVRASFLIAAVLIVDTLLLLGFAALRLDCSWPWMVMKQNMLPITLLSVCAAVVLWKSLLGILAGRSPQGSGESTPTR